MRHSAHLLVAAYAAGLATAATLAPKVCRNTDLSLNATNVDTLTNCTLYTYQCVPYGEITTYTTTAPPANCPKLGYNTFFRDYNMTGPLVVPRMVETRQVSIQGYGRWYANFSTSVSEGPRNLVVDSIDFPDLVNVTLHGLYVQYAQNVTSLKFPKVENIADRLVIDLSAGPAISLSFPSLRIVQSISIKGKIDALDFPVLNRSRSIDITSTGDLDCVAFAATVVNTTFWYEGWRDPEPLSCTSNKNSIKTHPVQPEDTSGSSGFSWFRADLLFLVVLVSSVSLVI